MDGQFYNYKVLATAREAKFTQEIFAKMLGVTIVTLSRIENGHNASYELLIKACQLLNIDSNEIFYSSKELSFAT